MRIVRIARNNVPMQMRRHIAESGQIDFKRCQDVAHSTFDCQDNAHAMRLIRGGKVGHFFHVRAPDHATKARIIGIRDEHDTAFRVAPNYVAAGLRAQFARLLAGLVVAHVLWVPVLRRLQQHALDAAAVRLRYVIGHPVRAEPVLGDFDHDVIGVGARVVFVTRESLQARRT